jgi:hypothetical protein
VHLAVQQPEKENRTQLPCAFIQREWVKSWRISLKVISVDHEKKQNFTSVAVMIGTEIVPETSASLSLLTGLIAGESFIKISCV